MIAPWADVLLDGKMFVARVAERAEFRHRAEHTSPGGGKPIVAFRSPKGDNEGPTAYGQIEKITRRARHSPPDCICNDRGSPSVVSHGTKAITVPTQ